MSAPPRPQPRRRRSRWTSFVADPDADPPRGLHEDGNDSHRLRVEHDRDTLLIHLSGEAGKGWTVMAVDRATRRWAVAQGSTQSATAVQAYEQLHRSEQEETPQATGFGNRVGKPVATDCLHCPMRPIIVAG